MIQTEAGTNTGFKMTNMFKDIELSKDIAGKFAQKKDLQVADLELESAQILSMGNWPINQEDALQLKYPTRLQKLADNFNSFYKMSFHNRQLNILNQYGNIEMKGLFCPKYIMNVSVLQACILSCFNNGDMQTYQQIKDTIQVSEEVLKHALKPLVFGNGALIKKEAKNLKWDNPNEKLQVNLQFASKSIKVQLIPKTALVKSDKDKSGDDKKKAAIDKERNCVIQGMIVKIMKTNQGHSVAHNDLISQTKDMIRLFQPEMTMIKAAIEHLILNQYMRRDDQARNKYWYIA